MVSPRKSGLNERITVVIVFVTPHLRLSKVLDLEAAHLRERGLRGLLVDVDCTLKDYKAREFGAEITAWVRMLGGQDIRLCLLSNGRPARIEALARLLDVPFVAKAYKPFPFGARAALRKLGLQANQVGLVGDQLFADVLAGRLAGLYTILVHPTGSVEPWFTRLKRPLERAVLRRLDARQLIATTLPTLPQSQGELIR